MFNKKVSPIARERYKQLCPHSWHKIESSFDWSSHERLVDEKIKRAVDLGSIIYTYDSGCYISRYYDLNFLVNDSYEVLTIWKDSTRDFVHISESEKEIYDFLFTNSNYSKAQVMNFFNKFIGK